MNKTTMNQQHYRFGRTGDDIRMILDADGRYVCHVQIHQTPRQCGLIDEKHRIENAELILRLLNENAALETVVAKQREALILGDYIVTAEALKLTPASARDRIAELTAKCELFAKFILKEVPREKLLVLPVELKASFEGKDTP